MKRPALCGWFADHSNSRRLPLLLGLLALTGSTLMLCFGGSVAVLVVARVLQGISGSVVYSVGLALLVDTVGPNRIAQMIGYVSLSTSAAMLIGPLLGGIIYNKAGYYGVFYLAFGLIFLDIVFRTVLIEKKIAKKWIDDKGPIQENNDATLTNDPISHSPATLDVEPQPPRVTQSPPKRYLSPTLTLLSSRRLWSALFCTFIQSILMSVWDAVLPLYVNKLFRWNSLGASLIFLPLIIPSIIAPLVGIYVDKRGPRHPAAFGILLCVVPLVLLRLVTHNGMRQLILLCVLFSLISFCLTITVVPFLAEITYVVAAKEKSHSGTFSKRGASAQAFGMYMSAFSAGILIGPLWGGLLIDRAGWENLTLSLAALSAICFVPALLWTGGWIFNKKEESEAPGVLPSSGTEKGGEEVRAEKEGG